MRNPYERQDEIEESRREGFRAFVGDVLSGVRALPSFFETAWEKFNRLTETNYELACDLAGQGRVDDAIWRFKVTLWLEPNHSPSLYNLGCLYHHKRDNARALEYFKKLLQLEPDNELGLYMVATINPSLLKPERRPRMVPPIMVQEYFDNRAAMYDSAMQVQGYVLPTTLAQMIFPLLDTLPAAQALLDLGCGTGLCATPFRERFGHVTGVDISAPMLDIAHERMDARGVRVYTKQVQQDARVYLAHPNTPAADVILAIGLFAYLGDLEATIAGAMRILSYGGLLVCNFEPYHEPDTYGILPRTGYFGHDMGYVLGVAKAVGFEVVRSEDVSASHEGTSPVCVLRKPMPSSENVMNQGQQAAPLAAHDDADSPGNA